MFQATADHGNSLSLETFGSAYTAAAPVFVAANGNPFADQLKAAAERQAKDRARTSLIEELERKHLSETG